MKKQMKFKTFLKNYCRYLTDAPDYRLRSFAKDLNNNYRAFPVVLLYAVGYLPNEKFFYKMLDDKQKKEFDYLSARLKKYANVEEMCKFDEDLQWDYKRVYSAYLGKFENKKTEKGAKEYFCNFFKNTFKLQVVSKYRACKDLKLNPANLNEFLKGYLNRLSLDKCFELEGYLKGKLTG